MSRIKSRGRRRGFILAGGGVFGGLVLVGILVGRSLQPTGSANVTHAPATVEDGSRAVGRTTPVANRLRAEAGNKRNQPALPMPRASEGAGMASVTQPPAVWLEGGDDLVSDRRLELEQEGADSQRQVAAIYLHDDETRDTLSSLVIQLDALATEVEAFPFESAGAGEIGEFLADTVSPQVNALAYTFGGLAGSDTEPLLRVAAMTHSADTWCLTVRRLNTASELRKDALGRHLAQFGAQFRGLALLDYQSALDIARAEDIDSEHSRRAASALTAQSCP